MNRKHSYRTWLFIFLAAAVFTACQQGAPRTVKPVFKKLTFVSYRPVVTNIDTTLLIEDVIQIDSVGLIRFTTNGTDGFAYDKIETDTSFRAPDSLIIALNQILNGNHKLSFYGKATLDFNSYSSAIPIDFVSYETAGGLTDKLVVFEGATDPSFMNTLNKFWKLPHARLVRHGKVYVDKALEKEIMASQREITKAP